MTQENRSPDLQALLKRAEKLRGAVARTFWWTLRKVEKIERPRSCLHPPEDTSMSAEISRGWGELEPKTPKWAAQLARDARAVAEREAQAVWPRFSEPDPLPQVTEGHRVAWSVWSSKDGDHRPYQTVATPTRWAELHVGPEGRKQVGVLHMGTTKQYATQQDALRAAHYSLCRHVAEAMTLSLRRAHGEAL